MSASVPDVVKMFDGWMVGDWAWCLHCSRAYQVGEFRQIGELQYCPYPDCDGDAVLDRQHWESVAENNGYPTAPQRGVEYPLYGKSNES